MVKYYSIIVGLGLSFCSSLYAGNNITYNQQLIDQRFLLISFAYMLPQVQPVLREARFAIQPARHNRPRRERADEQPWIEPVKQKKHQQIFSKNNNRQDRPKHAQINKHIQQYQGRDNRSTRRSK